MIPADRAAKLEERGFKGVIARDVTLARYTTYRLGGPAALYVEPESPSDVEILGSVLSDGPGTDLDVLLLGRGSNLVISDHGFPGMVVRLGPGFAWAEDEGRDGYLRAGAAMTMPQLANRAARRGLSGLEWMISIPGSVGGGVRMNAGAHAGDVAESLVSASVWDLNGGGLEERPMSSLSYSYRASGLGEGEVVLEALFALEPGPADAIKERMEAYRRHRAETQPGALQNAGSVFKNPPGDHAGRLVEACGLKGFRKGGARVSELHANFFIAAAGSTAQDVHDLVVEVRERVLERHGVALEPEIRFVGRFER